MVCAWRVHGICAWYVRGVCMVYVHGICMACALTAPATPRRSTWAMHMPCTCHVLELPTLPTCLAPSSHSSLLYFFKVVDLGHARELSTLLLRVSNLPLTLTLTPTRWSTWAMHASYLPTHLPAYPPAFLLPPPYLPQGGRPGPCTRLARELPTLPTCLAPSTLCEYLLAPNSNPDPNKVVDLGHARELPEGGRAYTMLGTPEQVD